MVFTNTDTEVLNQRKPVEIRISFKISAVIESDSIK